MLKTLQTNTVSGERVKDGESDTQLGWKGYKQEPENSRESLGGCGKRALRRSKKSLTAGINRRWGGKRGSKVKTEEK